MMYKYCSVAAYAAWVTSHHTQAL